MYNSGFYRKEKRGTFIMESLEEILHVAYEAGASDIHLTVGIPPTMRLNGHLVKMDYPRKLRILRYLIRGSNN